MSDLEDFRYFCPECSIYLAQSERKTDKFDGAVLCADCDTVAIDYWADKQASPDCDPKSCEGCPICAGAEK